MTAAQVVDSAKDAQNLRIHYAAKNVNGVLNCTRTTLENIKRRLQTRSPSYDGAQEGVNKVPFFSAQIVLQMPNIVMSPSIETIQEAVNKAVSLIMQVR